MSTGGQFPSGGFGPAEPIYYCCNKCQHDGAMFGSWDQFMPCPVCGADRSQFTVIFEEDAQNKENFYSPPQ